MKTLFKLIVAILLQVGVASCHEHTNEINLKPRTDSVFICQSSAAYAYHTRICKGLAHCRHTIVKVSKSYAISAGYKPCKLCYR
ncbi:hypothetical protein KXD93_22315 [Mucilaginibacter sp. BJC16-A38]|uniref:hypothetical protein n=1 Tax=Mucilaginibacter phenanthrenivorans TaxID=1234842 RepID=UPI0021570876|nr:hypothetical protein [Mucilaginibacter phenanthrenivorans]MCR8560405.1 hypothetical protein [Mucilaginibacter phenanthrenivorans]